MDSPAPGLNARLLRVVHSCVLPFADIVPKHLSSHGIQGRLVSAPFLKPAVTTELPHLGLRISRVTSPE